MAARGRKPKPTALKVLEGNPRRNARLARGFGAGIVHGKQAGLRVHRLRQRLGGAAAMSNAKPPVAITLASAVKRTEGVNTTLA